MNFSDDNHRILPEINIVSLIDVVLLMLIFFMLTSTFISQQGIRVNLPSAVSAKPLPGEDLVIFVDAKDRFIINKKAVTIKRLTSKIEAAAKTKSNILIKADKKASLGKVVQVWDLCRDAGITNINIATARRE